MRQRLGFAESAPEIERRLLPDRGRQRLAHQLAKAVRADACQHRTDIAGRGADMPAHEIGGGLSGGLERRVHGCLAGICKFGVIVREGGRSSTPGRLGSIVGVGGYWMPRLRGA